MKVFLPAFLILGLSFNLYAQGHELEALFGAKISENTVKIRVASGGCTTKKSFVIRQLVDTQRDTLQLVFLRVIPDNCEAYLPEGRSFSYSYRELGLKKQESFYIGNPFRSPFTKNKPNEESEL